MDKRTQLAEALCEHGCCGAGKKCPRWEYWLSAVDVVLDALMEPGEGALGAIRHGMTNREKWQAMLKHIREGGE